MTNLRPFGKIGFFCGFIAGCILRDEMNYSSYEKIDDILNNYQKKCLKLKIDRENINRKIMELKEEENNKELQKKEKNEADGNISNSQLNKKSSGEENQ